MKDASGVERVAIPVQSAYLDGDLRFPSLPKGLVLFAHAGGSSRKSPRNRFIAEYLYEHGIASLLLGLLNEEEDKVYENRFNIAVLAERVAAAVHWSEGQTDLSPLPLGLFGAGTGAAAALTATAGLGSKVRAIVSRGGRPDLAVTDLSKVQTPTLLIVGSLDVAVIELNQSALKMLRGPKTLKIVAGASHLFEEPGTLEGVCRSATAWFGKYFYESSRQAANI